VVKTEQYFGGLPASFTEGWNRQMTELSEERFAPMAVGTFTDGIFESDSDRRDRLIAQIRERYE
jgi:hypothetical protein